MDLAKKKSFSECSMIQTQWSNPSEGRTLVFDTLKLETYNSLWIQQMFWTLSAQHFKFN